MGQFMEPVVIYSVLNICAGYTVQGPENSINITVQNTTRASGGSCYLSCPFNEPNDGNTNNYGIHPCFYTVTVSEVIRGNYMVKVNVC